MTATGHALIGAAIALKISNPTVAIPLAFLSHFAGDLLPHWDVMTNKNKTKKTVFIQSVLDVFLSFFLVWLIFLLPGRATNPAIVLLGAFAAQLPDWLELPYFIFGKHYPFFHQNYRFQSWIHDVWFDSRLAAPWGVVTQFIAVGAFIFWAAT